MGNSLSLFLLLKVFLRACVPIRTVPAHTGLVSEFDLNNDGITGKLPGDAWGFGEYHGQYAFALLSKYEMMTGNTRTFQKFKWIDIEGAEMPTITICDGSQPIPSGMTCGEGAQFYSKISSTHSQGGQNNKSSLYLVYSVSN